MRSALFILLGLLSLASISMAGPPVELLKEELPALGKLLRGAEQAHPETWARTGSTAARSYQRMPEEDQHSWVGGLMITGVVTSVGVFGLKGIAWLSSLGKTPSAATAQGQSSAPAPAVPRLTGVTFFLSKNGVQIGPVSRDQVIQLLNNRTVTGTDLVWFQGRSAWMPLSRLLKEAPQL